MARYAKKRWVAYDPENGVEFFETREEAEAWAHDGIETYLDDTWSEEVDAIFVARIESAVTQVDLRKRPPDEEIDEEGVDLSGEWWDGDWTHKCNYKLRPVGDES